MNVSLISWYKPEHSQPENVKAVLVVYENQVWSGVYAKDTVVLYPEDFGSVRLVDCDLWAKFPKVPEPKLIWQSGAGGITETAKGRYE